jgi:hypothetical protein
MPYFTCIGGHGAVSKNLGRVGSRGYWILRRGRVVFIRFGPVTIERSGMVRVRWLNWQEVRKKMHTVEAAKDLLAKTVRTKCTRGHGYTRLPVGVKIR